MHKNVEIRQGRPWEGRLPSINPLCIQLPTHLHLQCLPSPVCIKSSVYHSTGDANATAHARMVVEEGSPTMGLWVCTLLPFLASLPMCLVALCCQVLALCCGHGCIGEAGLRALCLLQHPEQLVAAANP